MAQTQSHELLTAREIVQNLKNLYAGGREGEDVRLSDKQWLFNLDHHRAQLIRQQLEKGQSPSELNVQSLSVKVPKHSCGRWYTETPIPTAIELYKDNLYTFVGTHSGHAFQHTTAQKAEWEQYAKYTAKKPKWHMLGNTLFLLFPPSPTLNIIRVDGIFENPRQAYVYSGIEMDVLDYLNFPYPISRTSLDTIAKLFMDNELKLLTALPYDRENDGRELHAATS